MTSEEFHGLVEDIANAVLTSPDPGGTAHRLRRHLDRERRFLETPASMAVEDIAAAKGNAVQPAAVAGNPGRRRVSVRG